MRPMIRLRPVLICYGLWTMVSGLPDAAADTIRMKTGKEVKGIVVEDYVNRVIISTADGEQAIDKAGIAELYYDSEADNLIRLADRSRDRGDYAKAYEQYGRALKLNPASKAAQDGLVMTQGYLLRKDESKKADDIRRREEFELYGGKQDERSGATATVSRHQTDEARLQSALGITLELQDAFPVIASIQKASPVYEAGGRQGDIIAAVWSRLTGYMTLDEVINVLIEKSSMEVKATIERTVEVPLSGRRWFFVGIGGLAGMTLSMEFDGLTVAQVTEGRGADRAGLKEGDLITHINGQPTRYMPLKKAVAAIRATKGGAARITFRRQITMWRRGAS